MVNAAHPVCLVTRRMTGHRGQNGRNAQFHVELELNSVGGHVMLPTTSVKAHLSKPEHAVLGNVTIAFVRMVVGAIGLPIPLVQLPVEKVSLLASVSVTPQSHNSEAKTVLAVGVKQKAARLLNVQLMDSGARGHHGPHVVTHVEVGCVNDLEYAIVLNHSLEASHVWEMPQ